MPFGRTPKVTEGSGGISLLGHSVDNAGVTMEMKRLTKNAVQISTLYRKILSLMGRLTGTLQSNAASAPPYASSTLYEISSWTFLGHKFRVLLAVKDISEL